MRWPHVACRVSMSSHLLNEPPPSIVAAEVDEVQKRGSILDLDQDRFGQITDLVDQVDGGQACRDADEIRAQDLEQCGELWTEARGEMVEGPDLVLSLIHISEPTRLLSISYAVFCLK